MYFQVTIMRFQSDNDNVSLPFKGVHIKIGRKLHLSKIYIEISTKCKYHYPVMNTDLQVDFFGHLFPGKGDLLEVSEWITKLPGPEWTNNTSRADTVSMCQRATRIILESPHTSDRFVLHHREYKHPHLIYNKQTGEREKLSWSRSNRHLRVRQREAGTRKRVLQETCLKKTLPCQSPGYLLL